MKVQVAKYDVMVVQVYISGLQGNRTAYSVALGLYSAADTTREFFIPVIDIWNPTKGAYVIRAL